MQKKTPSKISRLGTFKIATAAGEKKLLTIYLATKLSGKLNLFKRLKNITGADEKSSAEVQLIREKL
jgi:hypothetical protein